MVACLFAAVNVTAQSNSLSKSGSTITISIDTVTLGVQKYLDTVDIMLSASGCPIAGADLKIGFDSYALNILEILRGELLDSCQWDFFDSKASIDQGKENHPRSTWKVLALSEFVPDSVRPLCYDFDRPVSIARLVVQLDSTRIRILLDSFVPIYFYWEDCTDNTVTNVRGDSLLISAAVDGVSCTDSAAIASKFPTRLGAPPVCISPRAVNKPVRKVVFQSGGIRIEENTKQ